MTYVFSPLGVLIWIKIATLYIMVIVVKTMAYLLVTLQLFEFTRMRAVMHNYYILMCPDYDDLHAMRVRSYNNSAVVLDTITCNYIVIVSLMPA